MASIGDLYGEHWKIIEELSSNSGQGDTFKVINTESEDQSKPFVLKILKKPDPQALGRFAKEIDASFALEHPHIVRAIDSSLDGTKYVPFLVTEYCPGGELTQDVIEPLTIIERLRMFKTICEAILFAHEKTIIHRDIKPRNIFFADTTKTTPVVGDFGLCFFEGPDSNAERLTLVREAVGARDFRPPEADLGLVPDMKPSFDVYSLGKLLYWFVSGGIPLPREYYDKPQYDLRAESQSPSMHAVYDVFKRSILETAEHRYQNVGEMITDIDAVIQFAQHDARYLDCAVPQPCVFCRNGTYQFILDPDISDGTFSYRVTQRYGYPVLDETGATLNDAPTNLGQYPMVLLGICSNCGNVQHFHFRFMSGGNIDGGWQWRNLPKASKY